MLRPSSTSALALTAALFAGATARADGPHQDPRAAPPYQVELGLGAAWIKHVAQNDGSGTTYGAGLSAEGFVLRFTLAPWLKISGRFERSYHDTAIGTGGLLPGSGPHSFDVGNTKTDAIYGYLHPTYSPLERLHLWLTWGIGWGAVTVPQITIDGGALERSRNGVFLEMPVGVGASFDILPDWMTISYDVMYGPAFSQTGDTFSPDVYVAKDGSNQTIGGLPKLRGSFYQFLNLSLAL